MYPLAGKTRNGKTDGYGKHLPWHIILHAEEQCLPDIPWQAQDWLTNHHHHHHHHQQTAPIITPSKSGYSLRFAGYHPVYANHRYKPADAGTSRQTVSVLSYIHTFILLPTYARMQYNPIKERYRIQQRKHLSPLIIIFPSKPHLDWEFHFRIMCQLIQKHFNLWRIRQNTGPLCRMVSSGNGQPMLMSATISAFQKQTDQLFQLCRRRSYQLRNQTSHLVVFLSMSRISLFRNSPFSTRTKGCNKRQCHRIAHGGYCATGFKTLCWKETYSFIISLFLFHCKET